MIRQYTIKPKNILLASAAALMLLTAAPVHAEEVIIKKTTVVEETTPIAPATGSRVINFMDFDINNDGTLSTVEVGEMLFKLFDTDGNGVIDNVEYEHRNVMTVAPMAKETTVTYDFDNDGRADEVHRTYETFLEETQLTRFSSTADGLSPREFLGKSIQEMDVNRSKLLELNEWRGAYIESIAKKNENLMPLND